MKVTGTTKDKEIELNPNVLLTHAPVDSDVFWIDIEGIDNNIIFIPDNVQNVSIRNSNIVRVVLGANVRGLHGETSIIKHVVLNENISDVVCEECGIETITSPCEYLPNLDTLNVRNNRIKDISFRTNYGMQVLVAGNEGIKFKYLCFMLDENLGFPPGFYSPEIRRERLTDYFDMVTDE